MLEYNKLLRLVAEIIQTRNSNLSSPSFVVSIAKQFTNLFKCVCNWNLIFYSNFVELEKERKIYAVFCWSTEEKDNRGIKMNAAEKIVTDERGLFRSNVSFEIIG